LRYKSRPLWFWNAPLSKEQTRKVMTEAKEKGYYGFGILPSHGMSPEYMSDAFLEQYKYALEVAAEMGMKMCLYDEFYFPSGYAGGNLVKKYPEAVSKRLDKHDYSFKGPGVFNQKVTEENIMGIVAMETSSLERIDLSSKIKGGIINASLPAGDWKVMVFDLKPDMASQRHHVDYLDPAAVEKFIELTYEKFYAAFPDHFGTTIDSAFYDEPCLRWVEGGRTWTGTYNRKFKAQYGFSPVKYYPSLWYDIGEETAAARNLLFGFRAELFASGFAGTINRWCNDHGIELTGHVDQEEVLNPVSVSGDMIKAFKYQDIPCVDQIAHYGRASKIYKVISSAAQNYGRPLVATEVYGAISNMPVDNLYKEAMDQYAKGINMIEPHAAWYDQKVDIPPNLSPSSSVYGPHLADYNNYIGRMQVILQGSKHVADIAVLYPIAPLQAAYSFELGYPGDGGIPSYEADYLDIGEMLSLDTRTDYTFIHPEVLDEKCTLKGSSIRLDNSSESSLYKVLILPGSKTIQWRNLQKIKQFYDNGGAVIATTVLPEYSAEPGHTLDVQNTIQEMFGEKAVKMTGLTRAKASSIWSSGGFLPAHAIDGNMETAWRPARINPENQWLEIEFGKEIKTGRIEIASEKSLAFSFWSGWAPVDEDQSFSFSLFVQIGDKWIEKGTWKEKGKNKTITFETQNISGVRVVIESGKTDKVSIPEILIFDQNGKKIDIVPKSYSLNNNAKGGKAFFTATPTAELFRDIMNKALNIRDIRIDSQPVLSHGNLTCMHKRMDGKNIYFFANSSDEALDLPVLLRGKMSLTRWNPHAGTIEKYPTTVIRQDGHDLTRLQFKLDPVQSVFFVSN
ncbi:MAG: discoidin domain-containing protein, partial [Phycisphaerae bacterium]|nr:discoidin domain-containing protein [Phycisphaerae bacterium]